MGWRDINMNRRRPQPRVAFVADVPGADRAAQVLAKAAAAAIGLASQQLGESTTGGAFLTGYLFGYARQGALRDGVDGERESMSALAQALAGVLPERWDIDPGQIEFVQRATADRMPRARLRATDAGADAGFLVGHLEALCGSEKLLRLALLRMEQGGDQAAQDFLTDCDVAADPMQTRNPTLALRFHGEEREVIRRAFAPR